MIVICHINDDKTRVLADTACVWATIIAEGYREDCPIEITDTRANEASIQDSIRTAVALRMSDVTKSPVLPTDIRLV